jgi:hypothetical protein
LQEAARYNLARAWAETYGEETEESNESRYALLSEDLQKSVDTMRRQNGATDEIWLRFIGKYTRFQNEDDAYDEALYADVVQYDTRSSKMNSMPAEAEGASLSSDRVEDFNPDPF